MCGMVVDKDITQVQGHSNVFLSQTLGNHEFDFGTKTLKSFIEKLKVPVVVSNLNLTEAPEIENLSNFRKSVVIPLSDGMRVGVVGYVLPDTMSQASTGKIVITSEIEAIK
ncbi:hypothetical protein ACFFRR_009460 [Megaselia abdita]